MTKMHSGDTPYGMPDISKMAESMAPDAYKDIDEPKVEEVD